MDANELQSLIDTDIIKAAAMAVDAIDVDGPRPQALKQYAEAVRHMIELERRGFVIKSHIN